MGFTASGSDSSLFVYQRGKEAMYLLVYVDNIILTASTSSLSRHIMKKLGHAFAIKDLSALNFFLGVQVCHDANGFFLNQAQ